jgi:hypothetical protein
MSGLSIFTDLNFETGGLEALKSLFFVTGDSRAPPATQVVYDRRRKPDELGRERRVRSEESGR